MRTPVKVGHQRRLVKSGTGLTPEGDFLLRLSEDRSCFIFSNKATIFMNRISTWSLKQSKWKGENNLYLSSGERGEYSTS